MKKHQMIDRYSELSEARNTVASLHTEALEKLSVAAEGKDATLHADIVQIAMWDAELDQREISNLISVVNSAAFDMATRDKAAARVRAMLELRND